MENLPPSTQPSEPNASNQGAHVDGDVNTGGGDFVGRDKNVIYQAPPRRIPLDYPERAPHFTGRAAEVAKLVADLQPGRVLTLCGPGGIGKTALAAEAIGRLADNQELLARFPDGLLFHTFYRQPNADLAFQYIAASFGEPLATTPAQTARLALSGRRALLVLDGAEEADDLAAVLAIRGRCGVLITSRSHGDALAGFADVNPLPLDEAVTLLQAWGKARAADEQAVQRICELVGELPLAVRLAGSYLSQEAINAAEYLAVFLEQTPLAALERGERQRDSVPLLLARSVAKLSAAARQALGVVGLLAFAPFSQAAIAAALATSAPETLRALGELVRYSLLSRSQERYEVTHRLVHTYAREHLSPDTETVVRLAIYYTALVKEQQNDFSQLAAARPHVLALVRSCGERQVWTAVIDLAGTIDSYLDLQGYWAERVTTLTSGLQAAQASGDRRNEGALLGNLGTAYAALGEVEQAIDYHQQALAIAQEIGDRRNEGGHLGNLGVVYHNLGQMEQAMDYHQQALVIFREIGDLRREGAELGNLGTAYAALGEVEQAIDHHQQALAIAQEIGDRRNEGGHLGGLGLAYYYLGEVEEAIGYYQQALAIAQEIGDRRNEGARLGNLGLAYYSLGEVEQAIDYHQQALAIAQEIGDRRNEGARLGNLGLAYYSLGEVAQAISYYERALAIAQEIGDRRGEGNRLGNLGLAYADLGQVEQAIDYHQQALALAREIGDRHGEGSRLGNLASAYAALGRVEQARQCGQEALRILEEIKSPSAQKVRQWLAALAE